MYRILSSGLSTLNKEVRRNIILFEKYSFKDPMIGSSEKYKNTQKMRQKRYNMTMVKIYLPPPTSLQSTPAPLQPTPVL